MAERTAILFVWHNRSVSFKINFSINLKYWKTMAFKASFKFGDSDNFDVLNFKVKFNRDVDPKGRPASDVYGGKIWLEIESTPDTAVLERMFKQYAPCSVSVVFKKANEDSKMKELTFENGYITDYEESLCVANDYPMTIKFAVSAQTVQMENAKFVQDWPDAN